MQPLVLSEYSMLSSLNEATYDMARKLENSLLSTGTNRLEKLVRSLRLLAAS